MIQRLSGPLAALTVVLLAAAACASPESGQVETDSVPAATLAPTQDAGALRVTRVIDGDTVDVCCPEARVRLLGIDAPERGEPYSDDATEMVERLTLNQPVRLEKCEEETDRYGRLLRHVFAGATHVNRELVAAGLARAYDFSLDLNPCYEDELREVESDAQWEGLGLWE